MELKPMYAGINNSPKTTLISEISATAQSIEVADISVFPPAPNLATIGTGATAEVIRYNGISGATLTGCERGFDGTTPGVWRESEAIYRAFTKHDFETLQENITGLQARLLELQEMIPAGLPSGGTTGQYLRKASEADYSAEWADIVAGSNPNLLDNWYFLKPINQRGETEYVSPSVKYQYAIDRWQTYMGADGKLTVEDGGIRMSKTSSNYANMRQIIENGAQFSGRTATLSFLVEAQKGLQLFIARKIEGQTSAQNLALINESEAASPTRIVSATFTLPSNEALYSVNIRPYAEVTADEPFDYKIIAAKLEFGDQQTLARQDAEGNWVLIDPPPNPALELLKCQRYFYRLKSRTSSFLFLGTVFAQSAATCYLTYPLPVEMRIAPTVANSDTSTFAITQRDSLSEGDRKELSSLEVVVPNNKNARIRFVGASSYTLDSVYNAWMLNGAYIDFSAEL